MDMPSMQHTGLVSIAVFNFLFAISSSPADAASEVFKTHSGWIRFSTDDSVGEATFRKYVADGNGFKNIINLHCFPGTDRPPYVSIDLGLSKSNKETLYNLENNPHNLQFFIYGKNQFSPGVRVSDGVILYSRSNDRRWNFDEPLTQGEFSLAVFDNAGKEKLRVELDDLESSVRLTESFFKAAGKYFAAKNIELTQVSTFEAIGNCK